MPYSYTNTKDSLGEQATFDALVGHTLTSFTDDAITTLRQYAFYNQTLLQEIHLPGITSIPANAFNGCTGMKRFFIGMNSGSVVILNNASAFTNTGRSIIYVPDSLVSNYRAASQWSSIAGRIYGYSDLGLNEWDETEISDSWTEIAAKIANGTAASTYHLGQYKPIDLGTEGTINFQIIGKNLDELYSGEGYAQLTWFPMAQLATTHRMNPPLDGTTEGTGTIGGWDKSEMKTYLRETIWPLIPEAIRNIIKPVKKYTKIYNTSGTVENNVATSETLFCLSRREAFGDTSDETQGPTYSLAFADNDSRIRKRSGSANSWWLRSAYSASNWLFVSSSGYVSNSNANSAFGVAFGFCT